jgi:hypothetical protein
MVGLRWSFGGASGQGFVKPCIAGLAIRAVAVIKALAAGVLTTPAEVVTGTHRSVPLPDAVWAHVGDGGELKQGALRVPLRRLPVVVIHVVAEQAGRFP